MIMRKILVFLLALVLIVGMLTGCGGNDDAKADHDADVNHDNSDKDTDGEDHGNDNDDSSDVKPLDLPIEEIALLYTKDLLEEKYDDAYEKYAHDDTMKKVVSGTYYQTAFDDLFSKTGKVIEVKDVFKIKSGVYDIVSIPIVFEDNKLNLNVVFDKDKYIAGINFGEYQEASSIEIPSTITEQELTADVNGYKLGGTLTLPNEGSNFPCVVLVHGSGANDRDESLYQNKTFRDIAWGLAEQGIAVYRYDKRNFIYGEELIDDYDFTLYDETIDDAVEITKLMQTVDNINKDKMYILGHSLGGFAMPRIAEDSNEANGFIIMAGLARELPKTFSEQYHYIFNADDVITSQEQTELDKIEKEIEKLNEIEKLEESDAVFGAYKAYWVDILNYNPIKTAEPINKPVLVLQGERDYQVTMEDFNMWKDAYGDKENWTFISYPTLNHLMMPGEGKSTPDEYRTFNRVEQKLIDDIASWIKTN